MKRKEDFTVFREVSGGVRHLRKNSYSPLSSLFEIPNGVVGKNGQPPLWVRVASFLMQFEWYRGSLRFRLKTRRGCFFVFKIKYN